MFWFAVSNSRVGCLEENGSVPTTAQGPVAVSRSEMISLQFDVEEVYFGTVTREAWKSTEFSSVRGKVRVQMELRRKMPGGKFSVVKRTSSMRSGVSFLLADRVAWDEWFGGVGCRPVRKVIVLLLVSVDQQVSLKISNQPRSLALCALWSDCKGRRALLIDE